MCILIVGMTREERRREAISRARKKLGEWCLKNAHFDLSCVAKFKIAPAWPRIEGTKEERERAFLVHLKLMLMTSHRAIRTNREIGHEHSVRSFRGQHKAYTWVLKEFEKVLGDLR